MALPDARVGAADSALNLRSAAACRNATFAILGDPVDRDRQPVQRRIGWTLDQRIFPSRENHRTELGRNIAAARHANLADEHYRLRAVVLGARRRRPRGPRARIGSNRVSQYGFPLSADADVFHERKIVAMHRAELEAAVRRLSLSRV